MTLTKNEIRRISALGSKKGRAESGLFIVEGEKMVAEALEGDFEVLEVYRSSEIGEDVMARISSLSSPSPVLAVCRQKTASPTSESLCSGNIYLALDGIKDPGNLGTILRIADWFGITKVLLSVDCVEIYNPKVVQSTMGAIFRVAFEYCDLAARLTAAAREGAQIVGTFLDGENIYKTDINTSSPIVIVIGSESFGIRSEVAPVCTQRVTIPSYKEGGSESLNAAIAAAITVAEFRRRL